jgi:hypothetical protein
VPDDAAAFAKITDDAQKRYNALYKFVYDTIMTATNDPRMAGEYASRAVSQASQTIGALKTELDYSMQVADTLLASVFAVITAFRKEMTETVNNTTAEVLNEFLGTEFTGAQVQAPVNGDPTLEKATNVGTLVLDRLEYEFTRNQPVTMESGAKGARTFAGYSVNFAIQNAIIATLGECFPKLQLDNLRELGVEVAGNLGLGRLMNRALRPLVENTITKPYNRQLQRRYRMDLLSTSALARAALADRMPGDTAMENLRQHGLDDDQIAELLEQHKDRLHAHEWEQLKAIGEDPGSDEWLREVADGAPKEVLDARLKLLTYKRLEKLKERVLHEMLSQVRDHWFTPADMVAAADRLGLPQDEANLWRDAAGQVYEAPRKRLSMSEMLFMFEAAQVTSEDVRSWATAEGYVGVELDRLLFYFELKATEAAQKTTGGAAALAGHLHKEHVAYMTDLITGLWSRPPTKAELDYWVTLLDLKERTKADVKNELKALDTSGPAMPSS